MTKKAEKKWAMKNAWKISLFLAIAFFLGAFILAKFQNEYRIKSAIAESEKIIAELGPIVRYRTLSQYRGELEAFIKNAFEFRRISEMTIWDPEGNILIDMARDEMPGRLSRISEFEATLEDLKRKKTLTLIDRDDAFEIWSPVRGPGKIGDYATALWLDKKAGKDGMGHVRMVREAPVYEIRLINKRFVFAALFLWVLATSTVYLIMRSVTRRIESVTERMWAHAAGIEYEPPRENLADEFGKLASAFNAMAERENRYRAETDQHIDLMTRQLEYFPDPSVFITDIGELLFANRRAAEFLGYSSALELTELSPNFHQFVDRHSKRMFRDLLKRTEKAFRALGPETFSMVRMNQLPVRAALSVACIHDRIAAPYFIVTMREIQNTPAFAGDTAFTQTMDRHITDAFSTAFEIAGAEINNHAMVNTLAAPRMRAMWNDILAKINRDGISEDDRIGGYEFHMAEEVFPSDCDDLMNAGLALPNALKGLLQTRTRFDEHDLRIDLNAAVRSAIGTVKGLVPDGRINFVFHPEEEMPIFHGRHRHVETLITILLKTATLPITTARKTVHMSTLKKRTDKTAVTQIVSKDAEDPRDPLLSPTDTKEVPPAGMWLSVAQKIADYNRGTLKMEYQEGRGLRIWLSFSIAGVRQ